jgi:hypothetical protein
MLITDILSIVLLRFVVQTVVMLYVFILSVVMLSVYIAKSSSVIILSVVALVKELVFAL